MDADRLKRIQAKNTDFWSFPSDLCISPEDVDWLIEEVVRLRTELQEIGAIAERARLKLLNPQSPN
jgi:hypothetical protein